LRNKKIHRLHFNNFPAPTSKKTFSAEARLKLFQRFNATANYIIKIIRKPNAKRCSPLRFAPLRTNPSLPIIWDYVKCFPLFRFLKKTPQQHHLSQHLP